MDDNNENCVEVDEKETEIDEDISAGSNDGVDSSNSD